MTVYGGLYVKAVVTGGAGFIGSNLTKQLIELGHQVVVLDDLSSGYMENIAHLPLADFVRCDVRDGEALRKAFQNTEVVFHLAASVGNKRSLDNPWDDAEINLMGTLKVLLAARDAKVRKLVFSSSAAIFGELITLPIREDHPCEPDTPYGATKLAAEKECLAFAKQFDMEVIALRYFNVYGPNQRFDAYGNVMPIFAFQIFCGKPITIYGDGLQTRDFVNVRDVVQANIKAGLNRGFSGAFNIGSGFQISILQLVQHLRRLSGVEFEAAHGAPRSGDVRHSLADISLARAKIGFDPAVSLDEGLKEYLSWVREEAHKNRVSASL